jgi:hypothetical protein
MQVESQFHRLALFQQTQSRPSWQMMGVDRVADRLETEKIQSRGQYSR